MAFTGNEGASIDLNTAAEWTANYRKKNPHETKGNFFGATKILTVLAQSEAVGIRMYNAIDNEGKQRLILVGVKNDESDMENGIIMDFSILCPPQCGVPNLLNGL